MASSARSKAETRDRRDGRNAQSHAGDATVRIEGTTAIDMAGFCANLQRILDNNLRPR